MCHESARNKAKHKTRGYLNDHFPQCLLAQYNSRASRTRRNENINEVSSCVELFTVLLGAFLLLNHFGKIECKGDGVSVTELRGHTIQGQLVTLRANKKKRMWSTPFLCLKPRSYIDVGVGSWILVERKQNRHQRPHEYISHLRSSLEVRAG